MDSRTDCPIDSQAPFRMVVGRLREGDSRATNLVYQRYVSRLIGLAQSRLQPQFRAKFDADDVVQSAFRSFFRRHAKGHFEFDGWDSLWALLARITVRKCGRRVAFFNAEKRDVTREKRLGYAARESRCGLDALSREPSPADLAAFTNTLDELLRDLSSKQVEVVLLRLEDFTNEEISERVNRTERTVYRILTEVRKRLIQLETELG